VYVRAARLAQVSGGRLKRFVVAPVDNDLTTCLRERERAGAAKPSARGAHDCFASGNSEIH
jgi:hypothetical protein